MKVFICKFLKEEGIERKIRQLISREGRWGSSTLRVLCFDEKIQKRLEVAEIASEVLTDFISHRWHDDEESMEQAYRLSDNLHSSAGDNDSLKFSGINFLTLESNAPLYAHAAEFSRICRQLIEQKCRVSIFILSEPFNGWLADINSPSIKTIRYDKAIKYPKIAWLGYYSVRLACSFFRGLLVPASKVFKRLNKKNTSAHIPDIDKKQPKALFVVSGSLYARPALAICNECLKNGLTPYAAPYDSTLASLFQDRHHFEYSYTIQLLSSVSYMLRIGEVIPLFFRLKKFVNSFFKDNYRDEISDEFSFAYLCRQTLLRELPFFCYTATSDIVFLEKMINTISPKIICVMPDGVYLQQLASALAKHKYHIPTLACSAALENGNTPSYMGHLHADKLATMGDRVKRLYVSAGVEPERIVPMGIAHFDLLFNRDREKDERALSEKGIDPKKEFIMFVTENFSVDDTIHELKGVIDAVIKMKDTQLVVKVHPSEDMVPYQIAVAQYHDSRLHVVKDIDLYALISRCELIIARFSTTALEAMMIDKPVVTINQTGYQVSVNYAKEGAALGVYNYDDIEPGIMKALYDGETRAKFKAGRAKFVRAWASEPDGKASQRIVNLMQEMIMKSVDSRQLDAAKSHETIR